MKSKLVLLLAVLLLIGKPSVRAQDTGLPQLEVITPENVDRLQEVARWMPVNNGIVAGSFSPDGQTLALALNDGSIRLLDTESLQAERILSGAESFGEDLRYSQDGTRLILFAFDGEIRVWDIEQGDLVAVYPPGLEPAWRAVDGSLRLMLTHFQDDTLTITELDSRIERFRIPNVELLPRPCLNADGTLLLTASGEQVTMRDALSGAVIHQFDPVIEGELEGFGFSPDGTIIWANWHHWLYNGDRNQNQSIIQFWDAFSGNELFSLSGSGAHFRMYFDRDGDKAVTAGQNDLLADSLWVWDLEHRRLVANAGVPTGGGMADFSPDGQLVAMTSGSASGLQIWDSTLPSYPVKVRVDTGSGHGVPPQFSPDGRLILTGGSIVQLWGVTQQNN